MTRVKICGITRLEDAVVAAELGAFAVGFVFWPGSPRVVDAPRARVIGASLPPAVKKVGVFVDQPLEDISRIADEARLDVIQLHGCEPLDFAARVERPVIKAFGVRSGVPLADLEQVPSEITVLLDAHDPVKRGGTGRVIDWAIAAAAAHRRPVVLSGGLTPENVADAIGVVRPHAVDLSSGVETAPGIKDHARLRALFSALQP